MTSATLSTPTTAERVRSACVRAAAAILAADSVPPAAAPVHHLMADGSFALTVPSDSAMAGAGTAGVAAVLELTDYAPLPLREPVRSLVWVRGRLHSVHDVRLPFPAPVHDVGGLSRAIRTLMGCPFVNGLRARRL